MFYHLKLKNISLFSKRTIFLHKIIDVNVTFIIIIGRYVSFLKYTMNITVYLTIMINVYILVLWEFALNIHKDSYFVGDNNNTLLKIIRSLAAREKTRVF